MKTEHPNSRRGFLRKGAAFGIGAAIVASGVSRAEGQSSDGTAVATGEPVPHAAQISNSDLALVTKGDIAILQFLAAAEALENDLWQQYTELAHGNASFQQGLQLIDPSLITYINDDRRDELSHYQLINAVLGQIGKLQGKTLTVDVSSFMVVPPPNVTGIAQTPRLTNLKNLTVDTSWYNRYRSAQNPDLPPAPGATGQLVIINGQPTVPLSDRQSGRTTQLAAHCAAFHFGAIEQGGASLYNGLLDAVISPLARAIVAAIGPTELYHFVAFHKSLERLPGLHEDGITFPNLRADRTLAEAILPAPCSFLDPALPLCSVVRPRSDANSGPLAAASGLAASGLFEGNPGFVQAAVALATAAETAIAQQTAQLRAFAATAV